jgi:hypothetical protein
MYYDVCVAWQAIRLPLELQRVPGTLRLTELQLFARDTRLYTNVLTPAHVIRMFSHVQRDHLDPSDTTLPSEPALLFFEFCELLTAAAVYRNPDPFAPLHERLHMFFITDVYPFCLELKGMHKLVDAIPLDLTTAGIGVPSSSETLP